MYGIGEVLFQNGIQTLRINEAGIAPNKVAEIVL